MIEFIGFILVKERLRGAYGTGDVSRICAAVANILCASDPIDETYLSSAFEEKSIFSPLCFALLREMMTSCSPDIVPVHSSLLNTGVPNEHTHLGAQGTLRDSEGLTGLLEIRFCTESKATLEFSQLC
jgi:hypothetical protein